MTAAKPAAKPVTVNELFKIAHAEFKAGHLQSAAEKWAAIVASHPAHFSSWMNLGTALRRLGHHSAAIAAGLRASALDAQHSGCLTNLGNALCDESRIAEALDCQRRAYALAPDDQLVHRNLAVACREAGLFAEAYDHFTALAQQLPQDVQLPWEQAMCLLYQGDYARAWPAFEARRLLPEMKNHAPHLPLWAGEDLRDKKILLTEEQGFGDTLLCARYLPLVIAQAAEVTLACKKPLHRLLAKIEGLRIIAIDAAGTAAAVPGAFDYTQSMMSLPGIFKTDLTNIPPAAAFTDAVDLPPIVQNALDAGQGRLRVGIIWSGSVTFGNNRKRSVAAERFLPLMDIPGVTLYSLQKGPRENDLRPLGAHYLIHEIAPHFEDFAQTATALRQLDLVIMTDSSVAHLAGSLGVPVWNLLHDRPYWLYLQERRDTPWYPSMQLYRQPQPGDWDSVFVEVMRDLKALAAQRAA